MGGLFDCCSRGFGNCLCAFFCGPCFQYSLIVKAAPFKLAIAGMVITSEAAMIYVLVMIFGNAVVPGVLFLVMDVLLLMSMRNKFQIQDDDVNIALKTLCCCCCVQLQYYDTVCDAVDG